MSHISDTLRGPSSRSSETLARVSSETREAQRSPTTRWAITGIGVLGLALPVAAYFWFIHHYGVNTIWNDQWDDVNVIQHSYSGTLGLGTLWMQHNENRIFFPNLIVLLLAHTTHFNIIVEQYLSGVMLTAAAGLFILAHKRRSPSTPWVYYCPVPILMLSLVQEGGSALWGFQMSWYLVMLALAVALFLLDRRTLHRLALAGAITAAVVGSFSSLQGLLIWPTGMVLLYHRRRTKGAVLAWIAPAIVTGLVYFYHFDSRVNVGNQTKPFYVLQHPITAIRFFLFAIGNIVGVQGLPNIGVLFLGIIIFAVAISVVLAYGVRRNKADGSPIGVSLVCFGLLFAATITEGRAWLGVTYLPFALWYTVFDLLIPVGAYLALLGRPNLAREARQSDQRPHSLFRDGPFERLLGLPTTRRPARRWDATLLLAIRAIVIAAICTQFFFGIENGLRGARAWHQNQLVAADVTVNIDKAPDPLVQSALDCACSNDANYIRQMVHVAKTHRLSLFATDAPALYAREGLPADHTPPVTSMISPKNGARLKGGSLLKASASDNYGVTNVEFRITGGMLHDVLIGTGTPLLYGWLGAWSTNAVPDGVYTLQSVAYDAARNSGRSAGITITVAN